MEVITHTEFLNLTQEFLVLAKGDGLMELIVSSPITSFMWI
jgi:hypothetical protein